MMNVSSRNRGSLKKKKSTNIAYILNFKITIVLGPIREAEMNTKVNLTFVNQTFMIMHSYVYTAFCIPC